ncbi:MAG: LysM peptidoglycan-binding domain-containing protein [Paludibacter sp.]|nr:LysM peptidoglycan-binding domain-containing protein [Paludibacter sp.]
MAQKLSDKQFSPPTDSTKIDYLSPNQISITDSIVNYGKIFLDTPYRYGSSGTSSFDCSGFTSFVYSNFGYNLERSSSNQAHQFDTVERNQLKSGDLVYFSGRHRSSRVGHVGIVVEAKEDGNFDFIHASVQRGVIISNSQEDYYKKRYIKANRVICEHKMLAILPCDAVRENQIADKLISTPVAVPSKETKKIIPAKYHRVKSGENLSIIADKYGITVAELKRKNDLNGSKIKPKQQLKIKDKETILVVETIQLAENKTIEKGNTKETEKPESLTSTKTTLASHTVKKGETLFSISKLYDISIDDLKKINNITISNIHFGDEIKLNIEVKPEIAKTETAKTPILNSEASKTNKANKAEILATTTHKVESGESLFSISKKFNISIDELKKLNQLTNSKIQPGQKLILSQSDEKTLAKVEKSEKLTHKVKSGESFYSIAKTYRCTIDNLKEWNNKSENKLNTGDKLIIYSKTI